MVVRHSLTRNVYCKTHKGTLPLFLPMSNNISAWWTKQRRRTFISTSKDRFKSAAKRHRTLLIEPITMRHFCLLEVNFLDKLLFMLTNLVCLVVVIRYFDQSNLMEKGFILSNSSRIYSSSLEDIIRVAGALSCWSYHIHNRKAESDWCMHA